MWFMATALGRQCYGKQVPPSSLYFLEKSIYNGTTLSCSLHSYPQERFRGFFFLLVAAQSFFVIKVCWVKILSWIFPPLRSRRGNSKLFSIKGQMSKFSTFQSTQPLAQLLGYRGVARKQSRAMDT